MISKAGTQWLQMASLRPLAQGHTPCAASIHPKATCLQLRCKRQQLNLLAAIRLHT
jgi:hypothetical protein